MLQFSYFCLLCEKELSNVSEWRTERNRKRRHDAEIVSDSKNCLTEDTLPQLSLTLPSLLCRSWFFNSLSSPCLFVIKNSPESFWQEKRRKWENKFSFAIGEKFYGKLVEKMWTASEQASWNVEITEILNPW